MKKHNIVLKRELVSDCSFCVLSQMYKVYGYDAFFTKKLDECGIFLGLAGSVVCVFWRLWNLPERLHTRMWGIAWNMVKVIIIVCA